MGPAMLLSYTSIINVGARSSETHLLPARMEATRSTTVATRLGLIRTRCVCRRNKGECIGIRDGIE